MGYSNYYGGYQPAYYQPPMQDQLAQLRQTQFQQPIQSAQAPTAQFSMPNHQSDANVIIWVQVEAGAKAYLVAPGASVMLMDSEKNTFYLKSSDQSGMPLPLRIFDYTERTSDDKLTHRPEVEYVTRKEFEDLTARINELATKETARPKKVPLKEESNNG